MIQPKENSMDNKGEAILAVLAIAMAFGAYAFFLGLVLDWAVKQWKRRAR
jgi:hypothetical protein